MQDLLMNSILKSLEPQLSKVEFEFDIEYHKVILRVYNDKKMVTTNVFSVPERLTFMKLVAIIQTKANDPLASSHKTYGDKLIEQNRVLSDELAKANEKINKLNNLTIQYVHTIEVCEHALKQEREGK